MPVEITETATRDNVPAQPKPYVTHTINGNHAQFTMYGVENGRVEQVGVAHAVAIQGRPNQFYIRAIETTNGRFQMTGNHVVNMEQELMGSSNYSALTAASTDAYIQHIEATLDMTVQPLRLPAPQAARMRQAMGQALIDELGRSRARGASLHFIDTDALIRHGQYMRRQGPDAPPNIAHADHNDIQPPAMPRQAGHNAALAV